MAKDYKKIGLLCNATARASERDACFRGVGNVAGPSSRYDVVQTIQKCDVMPSVHGRALCLQTASWGFASVPDYQHRAPELCRAIDDTEPWDCAR